MRCFSLLVLAAISLLLSSRAVHAQQSAQETEQAPLTQSDSEESGPTGCPVVCAQHQACVDRHCVDMCRPACRRGTFCSPSGDCEPLPQPRGPILTEWDRQELLGAESARSRTFVFLDVGGIIGFGARLGLETGTWDSLVLRAHLANTGIMSHAAYVENEQQRYDWGFGASVGYRHYEKSHGHMRGFYLGGGLDYGVARLQRRGLEDIAQLQHSAAPYAEFGYRWVFGEFAVGFGPTLSIRYPVASTFVGEDRDLCGESLDCREVRGRRFEGTMHIELGWFQ